MVSHGNNGYCSDLTEGGVAGALQVLSQLEFPSLEGNLNAGDEALEEPLNELFGRIAACTEELEKTSGVAASVASKLLEILEDYDELEFVEESESECGNETCDDIYDVFSTVDHAYQCLYDQSNDEDDDEDTDDAESGGKTPKVETFQSMVRIDPTKNSLPQVFHQRERDLRPFIGDKDDRSAIEFVREFERFMMRHGLLCNSDHTFVECFGLSLSHRLQEKFFIAVANISTYEGACREFVSWYP